MVNAHREGDKWSQEKKMSNRMGSAIAFACGGQCFSGGVTGSVLVVAKYFILVVTFSFLGPPLSRGGKSLGLEQFGFGLKRVRQ